jgi:hypothetical protein
MLNEEHFKQILEQVLDQVFKGKGQERHGHGLNLEQQPWKTITDNVGTGFVLGQALKKLMELRTFEPKDNSPEQIEKALSAWKREALGAIVYTIFAIMYKEYEHITKLKV